MIVSDRAPLIMLMTFQARSSAPASSRLRFEEAILPHLDAAYDLARWLTRNDQQAEDIVQTACVRALRFFDGFRGGNPRSWFLAIVRNVFYSARQGSREDESATEFDEELHSAASSALVADPETELLRGADAALLRSALEDLPVVLREALVLRELEGLSYREIAEVAAIPIGTVMSRLSRARSRLQTFLLAAGIGGRAR